MFDKIWRIKAVIEKTGYSKASIYRKIKDGTFPTPVQMDSRAVRWPCNCDALTQL